MTQSESPDKVFRRLTRRAAEDHFRAYLDSRDRRLAAFTSLVRARGGPELDGSEESVRQLGAWLLDALAEGARDPSNDPIWAPTGDDFPGRLSSESLQLLDGTALYFATVLQRRNPALRWTMASDRGVVDYQQPVLEGFGPTRLAAVMPIMRVFSVRLSQPRDSDWLIKLLRTWNETAKRAASATGPPADEAIDDVDVVAISEDPDWDVEIWIPDHAERTLGEEEFRQLPKRLEAIDGIERVAWEDRERFLAKVGSEAGIMELKVRVAEAMRQAATVTADHGK